MYKPHLLKNLSLTIHEELSRLRHNQYSPHSGENYSQRPQADYQQAIYEPMFNESETAGQIIPETRQELWPEPASPMQSFQLNKAFSQAQPQMDNRFPESLSPEQEIEMAIELASMAPVELTSMQEPMDESNLFSSFGMAESQGLEKIVEDMAPLSPEMMEPDLLPEELMFYMFPNPFF